MNYIRIWYAHNKSILSHINIYHMPPWSILYHVLTSPRMLSLSTTPRPCRHPAATKAVCCAGLVGPVGSASVKLQRLGLLRLWIWSTSRSLKIRSNQITTSRIDAMDLMWDMVFVGGVCRSILIAHSVEFPWWLTRRSSFKNWYQWSVKGVIPSLRVQAKKLPPDRTCRLNKLVTKDATKNRSTASGQKDLQLRDSTMGAKCCMELSKINVLISAVI